MQKTKGADLTWLWAMAAIVAILALMVWLFMSQPEETAVVTEEAAEAVAEPAARPVEASAVSMAPADFADGPLQIANLPVSALLGSRVFWSMPENGNLLLVVAGPEVTDIGWVTEGGTASVEGTIQPVTEAYLSGLVAEQALLPDGMSQAVTAQYYLAVNRVTP